jgi:hypothetical protein
MNMADDQDLRMPIYEGLEEEHQVHYDLRIQNKGSVMAYDVRMQPVQRDCKGVIRRVQLIRMAAKRGGQGRAGQGGGGGGLTSRAQPNIPPQGMPQTLTSKPKAPSHALRSKH